MPALKHVKIVLVAAFVADKFASNTEAAIAAADRFLANFNATEMETLKEMTDDALQHLINTYELSDHIVD